MQPDNTSALHVAIIMDGNGRWAQRRGLPRVAGHRAGVETVRRIVEAAPGLGIGVLTLYAFSSDNWQRPPAEVGALLRLLQTHLASETARCRENGIRLRVIGRRNRLPDALRRAVERAESATPEGDTLLLRLAIDYSARDAIQKAAVWAAGCSDRESFAHALGAAYHSDHPAPDVDLLIRTGGEQRLSDFLLWEAAYAELYFTQTTWPDFGPDNLKEAVEVFQRRERRFGRISLETTPPAKKSTVAAGS